MADAPTPAETAPVPAAGRSTLMRLAPIALIGAGLIAFFALGLHRYFTIDTLKANREALNAFVAANLPVAIALFALVYAGAVAISFPGASILTIFGGFLFGSVIGLPLTTLITVTAATVGATAVFLAAKTAFADVLRARMG